MTDLPAAARLRGAAGSEFPTLAHFLVASATRDGEAHTMPASPAAAPSSAAAGGGELLARLERKRGRRRKATR